MRLILVLFLFAISIEIGLIWKVLTKIEDTKETSKQEAWIDYTNCLNDISHSSITDKNEIDNLEENCKENYDQKIVNI